MSLSNKKLLILGANPETAGLVLEANKLGVQTVVTDYIHHSYAKRFAWKSYDIDAADADAVEALARSEKVDGILVGVAEALIPTYEEVCRRMGFPCYATKEQYELLISKERFKDICKAYQVPVVKDYEYRDPTVPIEFPVVVKPVDSSGSKGISVCYNQKEYDKGIAKALTFSKSGKLLVEKYMTGDEVVIYYSIQNGLPKLTAMCDRYTNKEQKGVAQLPTSYIFPSRYLEEYVRHVDDKVKAMLKGIGLQNGSLFIQSFIENGEVRFYEPGYRLNGAQEHIIVSNITGINAQKMLIHFALTGEYGPEDISKLANPHFSKVACKLSPLIKTGQIAVLEGLEQLADLDDVIAIRPSYDEGDTVEGVGTLKQIVCRFFIVSNNFIELKNTIESIYQKLIVKDGDGNNMLLTPFDTHILDVNYIKEG